MSTHGSPIGDAGDRKIRFVCECHGLGGSLWSRGLTFLIVRQFQNQVDVRLIPWLHNGNRNSTAAQSRLLSVNDIGPSSNRRKHVNTFNVCGHNGGATVLFKPNDGFANRLTGRIADGPANRGSVRLQRRAFCCASASALEKVIKSARRAVNPLRSLAILPSKEDRIRHERITTGRDVIAVRNFTLPSIRFGSEHLLRPLTLRRVRPILNNDVART